MVNSVELLKRPCRSLQDFPCGIFTTWENWKGSWYMWAKTWTYKLWEHESLISEVLHVESLLRLYRMPTWDQFQFPATPGRFRGWNAMRNSKMSVGKGHLYMSKATYLVSSQSVPTFGKLSDPTLDYGLQWSLWRISPVLVISLVLVHQPWRYMTNRSFIDVLPWNLLF